MGAFRRPQWASLWRAESFRSGGGPFDSAVCAGPAIAMCCAPSAVLNAASQVSTIACRRPSCGCGGLARLQRVLATAGDRSRTQRNERAEFAGAYGGLWPRTTGQRARPLAPPEWLRGSERSQPTERFQSHPPHFQGSTSTENACTTEVGPSDWRVRDGRRCPLTGDTNRGRRGEII